MNFIKSWRAIVGALAAVVLIASATLAVSNLFVTATVLDAATAEIRKEVKLVSMRLEQKIRNDNRTDLQKRIWSYEDRYGCAGLVECKQFMPKDVYELYRQMVKDLEEMK